MKKARQSPRYTYFPSKLYRILSRQNHTCCCKQFQQQQQQQQQKQQVVIPTTASSCSCNGCFTDIISWMPDGKSFKVHDFDRFANEIMPIYFGTSKIYSFQRNLNLWGFKKTTGINEWSHSLFLRDAPHLCLKIERIGTKTAIATAATATATYVAAASASGSGSGSVVKRNKHGDEKNTFSSTTSSNIYEENEDVDDINEDTIMSEKDISANDIGSNQANTKMPSLHHREDLLAKLLLSLVQKDQARTTAATTSSFEDIIIKTLLNNRPSSISTTYGGSCYSFPSSGSVAIPANTNNIHRKSNFSATTTTTTANRQNHLSSNLPLFDLSAMISSPASFSSLSHVDRKDALQQQQQQEQQGDPSARDRKTRAEISEEIFDLSNTNELLLCALLTLSRPPSTTDTTKTRTREEECYTGATLAPAAAVVDDEKTMNLNKLLSSIMNEQATTRGEQQDDESSSALRRLHLLNELLAAHQRDVNSGRSGSIAVPSTAVNHDDAATADLRNDYFHEDALAAAGGSGSLVSNNGISLSGEINIFHPRTTEEGKSPTTTIDIVLESAVARPPPAPHPEQVLGNETLLSVLSRLLTMNNPNKDNNNENGNDLRSAFPCHYWPSLAATNSQTATAKAMWSTLVAALLVLAAKKRQEQSPYLLPPFPVKTEESLSHVNNHSTHMDSNICSLDITLSREMKFSKRNDVWK